MHKNLFQPTPQGNYSQIPDAGYHLSYGLSVDDIIRKIESFSHQEYNSPKFKNREHIMRSITNEEDLFYRGQSGRLHYDYKKVPVPLQKLHEDLCKIQGVSPITGKITNATSNLNEFFGNS